MRVAVVDGQGGGIGKYVIERMRREFPDWELIALGTNAVAAANMLRAGANDAASGPGAIACTVSRVDVIVGPLSIVLAHSMLGELTPEMSAAIAGSAAPKLLLPLSRSGVEIIGVSNEPLPHYVDRLIERLRRMEVNRHV